MNGYMGKILRVDLSTGKIWDESLDEEYAHAFVGGSGLAARCVYGMVDGDTDPLGPENPLVFMTGPLVGTAMPSAGRCSACGLKVLVFSCGRSRSSIGCRPRWMMSWKLPHGSLNSSGPQQSDISQSDVCQTTHFLPWCAPYGLGWTCNRVAQCASRGSFCAISRTISHIYRQQT